MILAKVKGKRLLAPRQKVKGKTAHAKEKLCLTASRLILESSAGAPAFAAWRIPVSVIVGQIAHGASWDEVLADYPDLEPEDIQQALSYAAWLAQEEVVTA